MSRTVKQIILLILTLGWMLMIFRFSALPAGESMEQSDGIVEKIIRFFVSDFDGLSAEQQEQITHTLSMAVRKGAHMAEYAVLSILLYGLFSVTQSPMRRISRAIAAWGGAVVYAATDEFHQVFVPGRSGVPIDVLIDGIGALAGVLLAVFVARMIERFAKSKAAASSD